MSSVMNELSLTIFFSIIVFEFYNFIAYIVCALPTTGLLTLFRDDRLSPLGSLKSIALSPASISNLTALLSASYPFKLESLPTVRKFMLPVKDFFCFKLSYAEFKSSNI